MTPELESALNVIAILVLLLGGPMLVLAAAFVIVFAVVETVRSLFGVAVRWRKSSRSRQPKDAA